MAIKWQKRFVDWLEKLLQSTHIWNYRHLTREFNLLVFFGVLFLIIVLRLVFLQLIQADYYDGLLSNQHISQSNLTAERWHIYVSDKSGQPLQLTENITMYNLFVDPAFVWDKKRFITLIAPVIYHHLCVVNGMQAVDSVWCVKNIERFAQTTLLPEKPDIFYYGSGIVSPIADTFDTTGFDMQYASVLSGFTTWIAYQLIESRLDQRIQIGIKQRNYVGYFSNEPFLEALKKLDLPYITVLYDYYVYIEPARVSNPDRDSVRFKNLLSRFWYLETLPTIDNQFYPQENRYVRLIADANPIIAQMVRELKTQYYRERTTWNIPLFHGLGLEPYTRRYYPYGEFMSHVLWYLNKNNQVYYGIEQFFDNFLRWKDGRIVGRASAWIGQVWANEFQIEAMTPGGDIHLTIDPWIQKEVEVIAKSYHESLRADSVSIVVYDPQNGHVKAMVNAPTYDPNSFDDAYTLMPLGPKLGYVVDDTTHIDIPLYVNTGWAYRIATSVEREDVLLEKYIAKNTYGSRVFVDKNISSPYEPGSIFKPFTVGAAYDVDEVRLYDFYNDPWKVKVWQFTIKNAAPECYGDHSFLHSLVWSCNVWMVRVAQRMGKEIFYNYLYKLGFGQLTNIELAQEEAGFVEGVSSVSVARFFNNTFGQGLLTTPLQIAAAYAPLVNGGYYLKPTIVAWLRDGLTNQYSENAPTVVRQIFRPDTAEAIKDALFQVIDMSPWLKTLAWVEGYTLWWKSWTSQIAFRWKYQAWLWWTNASFVWLVTKDNPEYIVVVQVRRPRNSQWWWQTAWRIFQDVAKFLVVYGLIDS